MEQLSILCNSVEILSQTSGSNSFTLFTRCILYGWHHIFFQNPMKSSVVFLLIGIDPVSRNTLTIWLAYGLFENSGSLWLTSKPYWTFNKCETTFRFECSQNNSWICCCIVTLFWSEMRRSSVKWFVKMMFITSILYNLLHKIRMLDFWIMLYSKTNWNHFSLSVYNYNHIHTIHNPVGLLYPGLFLILNTKYYKHKEH